MRKKIHVLLDLFAKDTACMHGKTHVALLLDLSAKDTTVELMYRMLCMRGNSHTFRTGTY